MAFEQPLHFLLYSIILVAAYTAGGLVTHMAVSEKKEAQKYSSFIAKILFPATIILVIIKSQGATPIILAALAIIIFISLLILKKQIYYAYPLIASIAIATGNINASLTAMLILFLEGVASFNPKKTRKEKKLHYSKAIYVFLATTLLSVAISALG